MDEFNLIDICEVHMKIKSKFSGFDSVQKLALQYLEYKCVQNLWSLFNIPFMYVEYVKKNKPVS